MYTVHVMMYLSTIAYTNYKMYTITNVDAVMFVTLEIWKQIKNFSLGIRDVIYLTTFCGIMETNSPYNQF